MAETKTTKVTLVPFDTIFGRICLERGWATREDIIACLKACPPSVSPQVQTPFLAGLLVSRGVITVEQEHSLRNEVSRIAETGAYHVSRQDDASLGKLLVETNAVRPEQISEALRIQEYRTAHGQTPPRLGEILLELGALTLSTLQAALKRQESLARLRCPSCGLRYAISDRQEGHTYLCRKCTSPLSAESGVVRTVGSEPEEVARCATNPKNILGKYVVVKELGRGGSGAVYKAWDRELYRWVALKVLMGNQGVDYLIRFRREAETAAGLQHPNIVPIYDVSEVGEKRFIAMKYIEGKTLQRQKLGIVHACLMMVRVARAIDLAHKKDIVHRDLKPANIMVDDKGNPYVMDFGLAKDLFGSFQITLPGTVMGTPSYMPPEQAEGIVNLIDRRSDTYSLGAILYELVTGRPPFDGESAMMIIRKVLEEPVAPPSSLRPEIPPNLERILLRALAKAKEERYQSAAEFAEDLEAHIAGKPAASSPRGSGPVKPRQPAKWGKGPIILSVSILLLAGLVLILLVFSII